jgi:hypothetical protein
MNNDRQKEAGIIIDPEQLHAMLPVSTESVPVFLQTIFIVLFGE